jgi:hypothetical protein
MSGVDHTVADNGLMYLSRRVAGGKEYSQVCCWHAFN